MPLSIVSSDQSDGCDPTQDAARAALLVVLAGSDAELARYAQAWHDAGRERADLHLANLTRLTPSQKHQVRAALTGARGVLIHLPENQDNLEDVEAIAAAVRAQNIALAIVGSADEPATTFEELSNLPRTTLRRLASLCRRHDARSARGVLTQLSLSAGVALGLDAPACAAPEPIRGEAR